MIDFPADLLFNVQLPTASGRLRAMVKAGEIKYIGRKLDHELPPSFRPDETCRRPSLSLRCLFRSLCFCDPRAWPFFPSNWVAETHTQSFAAKSNHLIAEIAGAPSNLFLF
jgi:hypothetical protein